MSTNIASMKPERGANHGAAGVPALRYLVPAGRALFAAIFLTAGLTHFSSTPIDYATQMGLPFAWLMVPLSGVIALAGGLSIVLGYRARLGAGLIILFLVPVTVTMHAFWKIEDPMMAQIDQAMFMKNVSILGGALLIAYFGAGPVSLDGRR